MTLTADAPVKPELPTVTTLTVWKKPGCVQCTGAVRHLDSKELDYNTRQLLIDSNADSLHSFKENALTQAPIIQFPEVRTGETVLFEAQTVTGNRVDLIDEYAAALAAA